MLNQENNWVSYNKENDYTHKTIEKVDNDLFLIADSSHSWVYCPTHASNWHWRDYNLIQPLTELQL